MGTLFIWALPVFLLAAAAAAEPIFPSDGEDPRQGGGSELLEAVCPGRVASGKEIRCRIVCPKFTSFPGEDLGWSLARVTRGHFVSPTSEDAALSMFGCEPHVTNFGGTILLTRRANRWRMIWYKPGVDTTQCHKVQLGSGREILVCLGSDGAQGNHRTALYIEDLVTPTGSLMAGDGHELFSVFDNTLTCGLGSEQDPNMLTRAFVEKVAFKMHNARPAAALSVTASFGTMPMRPEDVALCQEENIRHQAIGPSRFSPATKSYQIDFLFNGHDYEVAPASAAASRVFIER